MKLPSIHPTKSSFSNINQAPNAGNFHKTNLVSLATRTAHPSNTIFSKYV